ncbi:glycoside hydrolase [Nocardia brasiliensis]|uniref:glycoside hydrolase n=1 Tax=Nocardia brasiliensis TaxID=37326 RepID=UPI0033D2E489
MADVPMSRRSALALAAAVPIALCAPHRAAAAGPIARYTMTAFTDTSESDLYVYESADALNFELLRGPAYRPPTGLLRDPSVFRHADRAYYLAYTTAWEGQTIGFARSTDRRTWNHLYDFTVPIPGVTSTWAPEWLIDAQRRVHVLVSLSDGCSFTPHLMTATDRSLRSWTDLTPVSVLPPPDEPAPVDTPGPDGKPCSLYGYIDTTVVRRDHRYYAFTKNETTKYVELAVGTEPHGPYTLTKTGDWAGWDSPREGQCVVPLPDGGWRIFLDSYDEGKYFYSDCRDDFTTWTEPRELPGLSGTVRHFTVLPEYGTESG